MGFEVKQVLERRLGTVIHMKDLQLLTFKQIADLDAACNQHNRGTLILQQRDLGKSERMSTRL